MATTPAPTEVTTQAAPETGGPAIAVGQVVLFKEYAELQEGQEPLFKAGDELKITAIAGADITVVSMDGKITETVYYDEITVPEVAPATAAAPKARARAAAPAKPAAATPAVAAAPAKPAGKAGAKAATAAAPAGGVKLATSNKPSEATKATAAAAKAAEKAKAKEAADKVKAEAKAVKDAEKAAAKKAKDDAKAAVKLATPQAKAEPEKVEITNTESLDALLEGSDALTAARSLIDQTEETFFTLGGVLAHIYHGELYKSLGETFAGKQGWQLYVEKELGVGYRKAMHLIDIYRGFTALEVDEKRLSAVGWSKAKELTRAISAENVDELLEYAAEHSKEEVIDYVKTNYPVVKEGTKGEGQPEERSKRVSFKFSVSDNHAEIVNGAIASAKEKAETADLSDALFFIIQEWAMLSGAVETTAEEEIARIEAKFGIQLGYVDPPAEGDVEAGKTDAE